MIVNKIGVSACRRVGVGDVCALVRNNNSNHRNIYALAESLHVFVDISAGHFLCLDSPQEAAS